MFWAGEDVVIGLRRYGIRPIDMAVTSLNRKKSGKKEIQFGLGREAGHHGSFRVALTIQ